MKTQSLTYRLPMGLIRVLSDSARLYGFLSLGEYMSLVITFQTYRAYLLEWKPGFYIEDCRYAVGCRVLPVVYVSVQDLSGRAKDTKGCWIGQALVNWQIELDKQEKGYLANVGANIGAWRLAYGRELLEKHLETVEALERVHAQSYSKQKAAEKWPVVRSIIQ